MEVEVLSSHRFVALNVQAMQYQNANGIATLRDYILAGIFEDMISYREVLVTE